MNTTRRTAIIVGILFIVGYIGIFAGGAVYGPILNAPDYLSLVYPNRTQLIIGMLIELANDVAVIGIAVLLFPLLKKHGEGIALGYVGIRIIEAMILVVSKIDLLSLIPLSEDYLSAGAPAATYEALGLLTLGQRFWASKLQVPFFIVGALILYVMLFRSRLVPRFISAFGLFAAVSLAAANLIGAPDPTQSFHPAMLLFLPIFVSELLLAVWLIVKGFNQDALDAEPGPASTRRLSAA